VKWTDVAQNFIQLCV